MTDVVAVAEKEKVKRRRRGDGAFKQDKDGLWRWQIELPRDPETGKRRFAKGSSMNEKVAMRGLNAAKVNLANMGNVATGSESVSQWLDYWMKNINRSRPSTRDGYRSAIKNVNAAIGKIKIAALTPGDIRKIEASVVGRGLSPTTALQAYRVLSKALKDAEREGLVYRNVALLIDPPVKAVPQVKVLTTDEGIEVIRTQADKRLGSRVAAALLTGARQGELIGLEIDRVEFDVETLDDGQIVGEIDLSWQMQRLNFKHGATCAVTGTYKADDGTTKDIHACGRKRGADCPTRTIDAPANWEHRHITGPFYWSRPKSKAGWRVIPLVEPLRSILLRRVEEAALEPNPHGLMWTSDPKKSKGGASAKRETLPLDGSPLDPSRDNKAWHLALEEAGVPDVRLHDARHTAVTILYDLGVPETTIQDIVGQSTISVTRGYRAKGRKLPTAALQLLGAALSVKLAIGGDDAILALSERVADLAHEAPLPPMLEAFVADHS